MEKTDLLVKTQGLSYKEKTRHEAHSTADLKTLSYQAFQELTLKKTFHNST